MIKMLLFLEALLLATSVQAQIFGESLDQNYGPIFSSVDSDLDDNMFENFVDFSNGNFNNYEDQMVSESVMTEEQLTARQVKLRELYKGRRPVAKSGAGGIRMNFFNRLKENKRPRPAILGPRNITDDKNITTNSSTTLKPEKLLDLHQSGMAVTVVKPPPDFVPSEPEDSKPQTKSSKRTKTSPFDWSRNKQKQRAALATSIIGSRLKDLKDKRKKLMNSNLVTERPEQRAEDREEDSGAQVLTVSIQEKSSETNVRFPTKKRRFKPQIKPTAGSQKWSIKEKLKNKNKLQISSVTKGKTKEKHENVKNEANVKSIDLPHPTKKEDIKDQVESISEELLNEVYKTSDNLTEEPVPSEQKDEESNEEKPEWMKKPKKMGKPLKKIDVEESAAPISIVPHGVPITRGFAGADDASRRVLVLPSSKPMVKAPVPVTQAPSVTQFLQFLPFTPSTLQTPVTEEPHLEPETRIIEETMKQKEEVVEAKEKITEKTVEAVEMKSENKNTEENKKMDMEQSTNASTTQSENPEKIHEVSDVKMTADIINENIEKVLNVTMPKHTKLLYGTEEGRRVERDPSAQVRLIYN